MVDFYIPDVIRTLLSFWFEFSIAAGAAMLGAGITVFGARYIFQRETKRNRDEEERKEAKYYRKLNNYFLEILRQIIGNQDKQAQYFYNYAKKLKEEPFSQPLCELTPHRNLKRIINDLEHKGLFISHNMYFNGKDKIKHFVDLFEALDFLYSINEDVKNHELRRIIQNEKEHKMKYNNLLIELRDDLKKYLKTGPADESETEFFEELKTILDEYQNKYNNEIERMENIQNEIIEKFLQIEPHAGSNDKLIDFIKRAKNVRLTYNTYKLNSLDNSKAFEGKAHGIEVSVKTIRDYLKSAQSLNKVSTGKN